MLRDMWCGRPPGTQGVWRELRAAARVEPAAAGAGGAPSAQAEADGAARGAPAGGGPNGSAALAVPAPGPGALHARPATARPARRARGGGHLALAALRREYTLQM